MFRKTLAICMSLSWAISLTAADTPPQSGGKLSAAEIVDKNVAARGGLESWRAVQTMSLTGTLGAGGNRRATLPVPGPGRRFRQEAPPARPADEVQLPFVMELKRPRKMRFELQFNGRRSRGEIGDENAMRARLLELEQLRT